MGERVGITSVCSAHPLVIEATLRHAKVRDAPLALIEATSNQVNQDGGYTGMTPADYRDFVGAIADRVGFPRERVALGGDHLGPNAWTALPAQQAMAKAEVMVADYVAAGFGKIHLDCSMSCADDPAPLPERTIAERAARLCKAAEAAYAGEPADAPSYVIGTEVPVPGGAIEDLGELAVTTPQAALATIAMHRDLFAEQGLANAWDARRRDRRPARRRVRSRQGRRLCPAEGRRSQRRDRAGRAYRVRGSFDRLPDRHRARRAGARSLRDPQGRPGPDVRPSRGAVGARCDRARDAAAERRANLRDVDARAHARSSRRTGPNITTAAAPRSISSCNTA